MVSLPTDHPEVRNIPGMSTENNHSLLAVTNDRNAGDHGYMMLYGTDMESQRMRYFYLIHSFENLVAIHHPRYITRKNLFVLRRITTPVNWKFDEWNYEMSAIHNDARGDAAFIDQSVTSAIQRWSEADATRPIAPYPEKKMFEDIFFFMMLSFLDELHRYWISTTPGSPVVRDPETFSKFLVQDTKGCLSVKTMIVFMLFGKKCTPHMRRLMTIFETSVDAQQHGVSADMFDPMSTEDEDDGGGSSANRSSRKSGGGDNRWDIQSQDRVSANDRDLMGDHGMMADHTRMNARPVGVGAADQAGDDNDSDEEDGSGEDLMRRYRARDPRITASALAHSETVDHNMVSAHIYTNYRTVVACCGESQHALDLYREEAARVAQEERRQLVHRMTLAME